MLICSQVIHLYVKPPLHRAATFMPPLSDQKFDQDAQWSPKPRKFCFCVTAAARPLCVPWTSKTAVVSQQVVQRRQNYCYGGRGRRMEAQWSPQWSLNGRYWSDKGGKVVVQGRQKHRSNWRTLFTTVRIILRGDQWPTPVHPFSDHGDACAFLLPLLSDLSATDLLGDLCATVLNMLKTSPRPWRPWRGLNVLCATLERPMQPFCFLCAFNGDLVSFVVAQGRHKGRSPCVKGVIVIFFNCI